MRRLCLVAFLGVTAWFAQVGGLHIQLRDPDFEYFYKGGQWLLTRGAIDRGYDLVAGRVEPRGTLDWYWPFVPRMMTLLALLPYQAAGFAWLTLNLVAMLAIVRLVGRNLVGLPPQDWPVTQLVPFLILLVYWRWEFVLNQINNLTLLLLVGSLVCWEQGRRATAGFWAGLAVLLKVTPALVVLWYLLKRQYRTVTAAVATVLLAGPVADLAALGPEQALASYRSWTTKAITAGSHRGLILSQRETDWRNQGLGVVLTRWLHPTAYNTRFDNDPRLRPPPDPTPRLFNVVSLPLPSVAHIVTLLVGGTLVGLVWLARRPAHDLTPWQLRFEWALFVLAMLWLMPVMRRYHMIWALPAVSLLCAGIHYHGLSRGWSKLTLACLVLSLTAQLGLVFQPVEARGVVLAAVVALAVPLIVLLLRLGRGVTLAGPFFAPPHAVPRMPRQAGWHKRGSREAAACG